MLSSCISSHVNDTINRTMEFSRRRSRRRNCLAQLIGRVVIKGARCLILASYVKKSGRPDEVEEFRFEPGRKRM